MIQTQNLSHQGKLGKLKKHQICGTSFTIDWLKMDRILKKSFLTMNTCLVWKGPSMNINQVFSWCYPISITILTVLTVLTVLNEILTQQSTPTMDTVQKRKVLIMDYLCTYLNVTTKYYAYLKYFNGHITTGCVTTKKSFHWPLKLLLCIIIVKLLWQSKMLSMQLAILKTKFL